MKRVVVLGAALALIGTGGAEGAFQTRAPDAYETLWAKADRYYGAEGQPSPLLRISGGPPIWPGADAVVSRNPAGIRTVFVRPSFARVLSSYMVPVKIYRSHLKNLLHEWAHVFQTEAVLNNEVGREWAASQFARSRALRLIRPRGARIWRPLTPWLARDQFGENWGANPRTIVAP